MENFIHSLYLIAQSPYLLFALLVVSACIKTNYIAYLAPRMLQRTNTQPTLVFLFLAIISALFCDISWFVKLTQALFIPMPYSVVVFFIRLAWAFLIVQYLSFSLFLESLTMQRFHFRKIHIPFAVMTVLLSGYFTFLAFFRPFTLSTEYERDIARETMSSLEFFVMRNVVIYAIGLFVIFGLYHAYTNIKHKKLPVIVEKQLRIFISLLILPYLLIEFILGFSFNAIHEMHFLVSLSTLFLAVAVYYCLHQVLKLRFMNVSSRVQEKPNPYMIDNFKIVLDQLSNAKTMEELSHISQAFFRETFRTSAQSIHLFIKESQLPESVVQNSKLGLIESFMKKEFHADGTPSILVYDEIAFTNFYHETNETTHLLQFLEHLQCAILLPIYSKKDVVGYITVDTSGRNYCYSHAEQDAMSAFASYLGNIINLLQNKNLNVLVSKEKKLKDELYTTHQEINQYKESVHGFLRRSKEKSLGIIFYKNGRFIPANHDAKKIVDIDLNEQDGHPLTQAFHHVAHYVQTYQTSYNYYTHDVGGKSLLLSGVPHLKQESVIITVSYPEVSDVIMQQIHMLHSPNDWDYLLYLTTTNAGSLINSLIPASGEQLLNIKIALLKAALHKKALLLDVPQQDLPMIVDVIHKISGRETLQIIELNQVTTSSDIAIALFGDTINPAKQSLLQRLDNGTLFIKNAHFLDMVTQGYLVEYIRYGMYRVFNSDQKVATNCRIICSTNQNMVELMQKGNLSPDLFKLFKKATVTIPSVLSLDPSEISDLIDGYTDKIISSHALKKLFALTTKEKQKIIDYPLASMKELRARVEQIILHKSEDSVLDIEQGSTSSFDDPDLTQAVRLGKHALKDPAIMQKLWDKFKNQNKIALFLGVNRSSVNRRFKFFDIGKEHEGVA